MFAFWQRLFRGEFPFAVFADDHFTDRCAIVFDNDCVAWGAAAGKGRGPVIGGVALLDRALYCANVVAGTANGRRTRNVRAWVNIVVFFIVVASQLVGCAQQTERAQPQQCRPEPANAAAGNQTVTKARQLFGTQYLGRRNAIGEECRGVIVFRVGGNVLVVGAVFSHTDQLTVAFVEALNDQLWLVGISPFSGHMQVIAHTLDGQVLGSHWFISAFGEDVLTILDRLDANRVALFGGAKLHRFGNRFAVHYGDVHCVCVHCDAFIRQIGHRAGEPARPNYPRPVHLGNRPGDRLNVELH